MYLSEWGDYLVVSGARKMRLFRGVQWRGVCEVREDKPHTYQHHTEWPTRSESGWVRFSSPTRGHTNRMDQLIAEGWWYEVFDDDLTVAEGL